MTDQFNDDELKTFLKKNQPIAPPAPHGQLDQLLKQLGLGKRRPKIAPMFAWGGLVAASFAVVFIFFGTQQSQQHASPKIESVAYEVESEEDYYEEELPSLGVGGDYFDLVASIEE